MVVQCSAVKCLLSQFKVEEYLDQSRPRKRRAAGVCDFSIPVLAWVNRGHS